MEQDRKSRAKQERAPRWHFRAASFHVALAETESVVPQMVELHCVHRAEHHQAQGPQNAAGRSIRQAHGKMKRVVDQAKSRQEEHEGKNERKSIPS